jgi:hypothetical protein
MNVPHSQVSLAALLDHPNRAVGEHVNLSAAVGQPMRGARLVVGPRCIAVGERLVRNVRRRRNVENADVVAGAEVVEQVIGIDRG